MRKSLFLLCLGLLGVGAASAKTPDGQPPSVETVCDNETGAAFGLCNAYCEAMDCDSPNPHASEQGCTSVRENFERKTGRSMPCEVVCPCIDLLPLFADIVNGTAIVEQCLIDPSVVSILTSTNSFALVVAGSPPFCSVDFDPLSVEFITATEELVCRIALREAAEAQGVPCVPPE